MVDFDPKWPNYSFCKVAIPDGSTMQELNFTQLNPNTPAISGRNLTFIDCNLGNCAIDPSWTIKGCNTSQAWVVEEAPGNVERVFIASHPAQLTGQEVQPANVVRS